MAWALGAERRLSLLVAVMAVLAGAACADSGESGPLSGPGTGGASSAAPDSTTFAGDARAAVDVSELYWKDRLPTLGAPFHPIRPITPYRTAGQVSCAGEAMGANNAAYCSEGDFIACHEPWAHRAYDQIGDAFIYYMLAHEYAHGIQVRLGGQYQYTIEQELQADCMAGAVIGDSIKDGRLQLEDGDVQELKNGLIAVADAPGQPWFAEGSHGTAEQRTQAFFSGYDRSLGACDL
jgi:predicted metalloprotease